MSMQDIDVQETLDVEVGDYNGGYGIAKFVESRRKDTDMESLEAPSRPVLFPRPPLLVRLRTGDVYPRLARK